MSDQPTEAEPPDGTESEAKSEQQPEPESRQERRDAHVREQLRTVEAERDQLRDRLDQRDRAQVEAAARAALGERGASLLRYELADLRDESGNLDIERVAAIIEPVKAALEEGRIQHHGDMGARREPERRKGASWDQLIQQGRRT